MLGGVFEYFFDPRAINAKAPIHDIINITTGKPQLGRVIHLTFFAMEKTADGSPFGEFQRVILRGSTAICTR